MGVWLAAAVAWACFAQRKRRDVRRLARVHVRPVSGCLSYALDRRTDATGRRPASSGFKSTGTLALRNLAPHARGFEKPSHHVLPLHVLYVNVTIS